MKRRERRKPLVSEAALVTSVNGACVMLDCGRDKLYELCRLGELESYLDGKVRRITVASIKQRIERKLAAAKTFERARYPNQERAS